MERGRLRLSPKAPIPVKYLRYLWLSCSGFRTYLELLNLPLRATFGYWACFSGALAVVAIVYCMVWSRMASPLIVRKATEYLPPFTVENGQIHSSLPQPHFSNTNDFPVIMDLEGSLNEPEKMFAQGLILRKKELRVWTRDGPRFAVPFERWPDGTVDGPYLEQITQQLSQTIPFLFPIIWLSFMLLGLLQAFIFTVLAGLLERSIDPCFNFSQLFNICLFSITPGAIIVATYMSCQLLQFRLDLLYFACYCFFLVMASGACRMKLRPPKDEVFLDE